MMTKEEAQAKLTEMGVKFDKRWGMPKLEKTLKAIAENAPEVVIEDVTEPEFPKVSEVEIQLVTDQLTGKFDKPIEEFTSRLDRETGYPTTETGIIIPWSTLAKMRPTKWTYNSEELADKAVIERMMYNGRKEYVREYSRSVHGDNFKALARQFVDKNNK